MCPVSLMAEHCALGLLGKWQEAYMPTHTSLAQAQTQSLEFATFCAPQYFDICSGVQSIAYLNAQILLC